MRFSMFVGALPGVPPVNAEVGASTTRLTIDTSVLEDQDGLLADTLLAVVHRFIGWLLCTHVPLRAVEVPYRRPEDVTVYGDLFGMVPTFEAGTAALVIDNTVLHAPLMRDEAALTSFLAEAPAGLLARREHGSTVADRVRRLLERDLTVDLSADQVAARLSMAGPTLRRKLREAGSSYREIRENLLRDAAVEALVHSDVTVAELSHRLGFSETSAFVRAFRRWTGMAPGSYRNAFSAPPRTAL